MNSSHPTLQASPDVSAGGFEESFRLIVFQAHLLRRASCAAGTCDWMTNLPQHEVQLEFQFEDQV